MSRWSYSNKYEVEDCKELSVKFLREYGYFDGRCTNGEVLWSCNGNPNGSVGIRTSGADPKSINIYYTSTDHYNDKKTDVNLYVPIVSTRCYFGGVRRLTGTPRNRQRVSTLVKV